MPHKAVLCHSQYNTVSLALLYGVQTCHHQTWTQHRRSGQCLYAHGAFIYLVNSEHIEMCDVILLSIFDSGSALLLVYQFTHIFIHKLSLSNTQKSRLAITYSTFQFKMFKSQHTYFLNVSQWHQAPAFACSADDLGLGVETFGEVLVLAAVCSRTHLRMALVQQHAVQTLGLKAAGAHVWRLTVTLGDLRDVCGVDLYSPTRLIRLTKNKY